MANPKAHLLNDEARRQRAIDLLRAGQAAPAEKELKRLLKRQPKDPALLELLGLAVLRLGRPGDAVKLIERAIAGGLADAGTHSNLSLALSAADRLEEAAEAARKASALAPDSAELRLNLGNRLKAVERLAEAKSAYEGALALKPNLVSALTALGHLEAALGARKAARTYYQRALAAQPSCVPAFYHLALSEKSGESALDDGTIARFQARAAAGGLTPGDAAMIHSALGLLAERRGAFDRAFGHYAEANRARGQSFDRAAHGRFVDQLIEAFPASLLETSAPGASDSRRPILIVGMPRSGTTLIDQILANHPEVAAGGERLELPRIADALPNYPGASGKWGAGTIEAMAARYLADLARVDPQAPRVTDKYPLNFLHLGLLARLLPGARIVHCRRDPRDTCLSCFTQNFASDHAFSHDLADLGAFYGGYVRLMDHWRQVLPMKLVEVDYEALTEDPEPVVRGLLAGLDLSWAPGCLDLAAAKNPIFTASQWQARTAINRRAVGRWRAFEPHLGPLIEALGPLATP
ncbi:MAG: sulfotransferase [Pseudomonadota bacterium]